VKRREFISLLGSAAAWPLTAHAQKPAMPVVGFLGAGSLEAYVLYLAAFRKGLGETGLWKVKMSQSNTAGRRVSTIGCRSWRPIWCAVALR